MLLSFVKLVTVMVLDVDGKRGEKVSLSVFFSSLVLFVNAISFLLLINV